MTTSTLATRRAVERDRLIAVAAEYLARLGDGLVVDRAVVVGSVARGDFNAWSDVDLVVVAAELPAQHLERYALLGRLPPRLEVVLWTTAEWARALERRNPLAVEAVARGVWLRAPS